MNRELSQNIEIFIDKLGLELTQSGDNYQGTTQCHEGDSRGLSIYLGDDGLYRWNCFSHNCQADYGIHLCDLARCILDNRKNKIHSYLDIKKFFEDSDLKSFSEFKKKLNNPKKLYALWKNIKNESKSPLSILGKGVFLQTYFDDIM